MPTFRFVGTESEIGGEGLRRFGQRITLSDSRAKEAIMGAGKETAYAGATAIIPDEAFEKLKVSDQEMDKYAYPGQRNNAPPEFRAKVKAALEALAATRETYEREDAAAAKASAKAKEKK